MSAAPRPIFVLGMPRSGTTLVEQILASHPDIHGAGELNHIQHLVGELGDFPAAVAGITPAQLARLGDAYRAAIAPLAQGRRHVVDKMPANFLYAGLIHADPAGSPHHPLPARSGGYLPLLLQQALHP